jgi:hypothetical protein
LRYRIHLDVCREDNREWRSVGEHEWRPCPVPSIDEDVEEERREHERWSLKAAIDAFLEDM